MKSNYPDVDITVVDCLTEGIDNWIKKNFPLVKLVHFDYDEGIPARKNAGLTTANTNSKYIIFMDEDIEAEESGIFSLVEAMESDPSIGVAQPRMLTMHNREKVDSMGCFLDLAGYPYRSMHGKAKVEGQRIREISYAETATLILRRDVLKGFPDPHKPFDPDYLVHWYDVDFSWKIRLAGYRVVLVPNSVVYHERGLSGGLWKLPCRNIFLNTRNRMMTLIKNYSLQSLARYFPVVLMFELVKIVALLRRRPDHAIATLMGTFWVLRNLKGIWKKRVVVQTFIRKVPESDVLACFIRPNPLQLYRYFQMHYKTVP